MREVLTEHYAKNFDELVKRYDRRAGGVMNAEDVVQEGYYRALKYCHSYDPDIKPLDEWLGTILNNVLKDQYRNESPCTQPEEEEYTESADDEHSRRAQLRAAVDQIESYDQPKRDILRLWYINQYSRKDIRAILDVTKKEVHATIAWFNTKMRRKGET